MFVALDLSSSSPPYVSVTSPSEDNGTLKLEYDAGFGGLRRKQTHEAVVLHREADRPCPRPSRVRHPISDLWVRHLYRLNGLRLLLLFRLPLRLLGPSKTLS